jgi:hypothetical protein
MSKDETDFRIDKKKIWKINANKQIIQRGMDVFPQHISSDIEAL